MARLANMLPSTSIAVRLLSALDRQELLPGLSRGAVSGDASPSRNLARYVHAMARYIPNLDVKMIYRLDRFGRLR